MKKDTIYFLEKEQKRVKENIELCKKLIENYTRSKEVCPNRPEYDYARLYYDEKIADAEESLEDYYKELDILRRLTWEETCK